MHVSYAIERNNRAMNKYSINLTIRERDENQISTMAAIVVNVGVTCNVCLEDILLHGVRGCPGHQCLFNTCLRCIRDPHQRTCPGCRSGFLAFDCWRRGCPAGCQNLHPMPAAFRFAVIVVPPAANIPVAAPAPPP